MVEEAEKSCARLVALIGELSDIAKLDDGRRSRFRRRHSICSRWFARSPAETHEAADRGVQLEVRGAGGGRRHDGRRGPAPPCASPRFCARCCASSPTARTCRRWTIGSTSDGERTARVAIGHAKDDLAERRRRRPAPVRRNARRPGPRAADRAPRHRAPRRPRLVAARRLKEATSGIARAPCSCTLAA